MRLYLDDNMTSHILAKKLQNAGHDVQLPADVGMSGEDDPVHLTHAIVEDRVCLSYNYGDFEILHNLVITSLGHHPGILVVRRDNDLKRDMSNSDIVRAIGNLLAAGVPIIDQCIILNHWR